MIKGINSSSRHITVSGGSVSGPYINNYSGQSMVGQLRYNNSTSNLEVYNGTTWISMPAAYPSIQMNPAAESAIDWAMRKQAEEYRLQELMEKHPGLKEAYERLEIMKALCLEEEKLKHD